MLTPNVAQKSSPPLYKPTIYPLDAPAAACAHPAAGDAWAHGWPVTLHSPDSSATLVPLLPQPHNAKSTWLSEKEGRKSAAVWASETYHLNAWQKLTKTFVPRLRWELASTFATPGRDRDFEKFPALIRDETPREIWSVGDPHAAYGRLTALLAGNGLIHEEAGTYHWAGGTCALVCTGDLIDKGEDGLGVIRLFQSLAIEAEAAGGRVIVTMGNHELSFALNPYNAKAMGPGGISWELMREGISRRKAAQPDHPLGGWLYNLPFGAVVGDFFFAHGGQPSSRTFWGLKSYIEVGIARDGFKSLAVAGENSLLRARDWYGNDGEQGPRLAKLLGVDAIVFGHDPDSMGPVGKILFFGKDSHTKNKSLVRQDCGMSPGITSGDGTGDIRALAHGGYSHGELLRIRPGKHSTLLEAYDPSGRARTLGHIKKGKALQ